VCASCWPFSHTINVYDLEYYAQFGKHIKIQRDKKSHVSCASEATVSGVRQCFATMSKELLYWWKGAEVKNGCYNQHRTEHRGVNYCKQAPVQSYRYETRHKTGSWSKTLTMKHVRLCIHICPLGLYCYNLNYVIRAACGEVQGRTGRWCTWASLRVWRNFLPYTRSSRFMKANNASRTQNWISYSYYIFILIIN
jgi:hypothetical protein